MFNKTLFGISGLALVFASPTGWAGNFSFSGSFSNDADIELIQFSLSSDSSDSSDVIIETLSRNGGINLVGEAIAAGGFDPYLALFNEADGSWIFDTRNKNGGDEAVIAGFGDLLAGNYILVLTQYDNVAAGINLADGFAADWGLAFFGDTPFTANGGGGGGHWAVDIRHVDTASLPSQVPLPGSGVLLLSGLLGLVARRQYRYR